MAQPHHAPLLSFACLALLCAGCGKDDTATPDDTSSPSAASHAVVEIVSPSQGDSLDNGDQVALEVSITDEDSGEAMDYDAVAWSAEGGWSYDQASGTVNDLPVGSYDLQVTVTVSGRELTDQVSITVEDPKDPITYRGQLDSTIYLYSNDYDMDDEAPCVGDFEISTDESWNITGTGVCDVELFWGLVDWDVIFEIDGKRTDGNVEGTLFFFDDHGTRYETPYAGTISDKDINTDFDADHENEDGQLSFWGTMNGLAMP
jgi:hypothetical protein